MKYLICLILIFSISAGKAQELKKVVNRGKGQNTVEEFYVLKNQPEIKQGSYQKIQDGFLVEKGYFNNNLKDSTWSVYFSGSRQPMEIGKYKNDKKTGIWEEWTTTNNYVFLYQKGKYKDGVKIGAWQFYDMLGDVNKVYDYSSKTLYFEKPAPEKDGKTTLTSNGWVVKKLDRDPTPITKETEEEFMRKIARNMKYPNSAASQGYQGLVVITFIINEDGSESDYQVVKSIERSLDEEAIRVMQLIARKWEPGILEGKPVKTKNIFPLRYTIK